ncbi:MAG TPA: nucleoside triphosphate pyrophosphohydrolase [Chitinophagales bacterium]|nr:nucleoside triphosphate pyrophosphohydrolase [Chitinophagales bacterium]
MSAELSSFERLLQIMNELRAQCPWDKKQTIHSLRKLTIEETYELSEAILNDDWKNIKEELGDLFLHLVFYAKIADEQKQFTVDEMLNAVCDKLIHRHPHIYGDVEVKNEEDVKKNWEQLKLKEGKKSILEGVPNGLPPVTKAQRIQEKVRQVGFDWDYKEQVMDKIEEEIAELKEAVQTGNPDEIELEFGDVLFALINYARFIDVDAEKALDRTNKKFMERFMWMEKYAKEKQLNLHEMNLAQLDEIWNLAKEAVKKTNSN